MANLVKVEGLKKYFPVKKHQLFERRRYIHAIDDVSLEVREGETLGLVGESGCGKSTLGKTVLRLYEPSSGKIYFRDKDIVRLRGQRLKDFRKNAQIIFQDPYASLNPRMRVKDIIEEPLLIHGIEREERERAVDELMELVGLNPEHRKRFPHEFSGGQRQRISIARALALKPRFVVCDEPVSALDVSIQAQILNLLKDLQERFSLTYLFISHDLSVVKHICDRVAVMYLGKVVEVGLKKDVYERPFHPYTVALLSAVPLTDPKKARQKKRIILKGDLPSAAEPPAGCRFHTRCYKSQKICSEVEPVLREMEPFHLVACHFPENLS